MNTLQSDVTYVTDPKPELTIYCDGLCEPNPRGLACWGWYSVDSTGHPIAQNYGVVGEGDGMTNNVAEYHAVLAALGWAWKTGHRSARVRTDSQLLVCQVSGKWACGAPGLLPLLSRVQGAAGLMRLDFEWIPREQNGLADALSRRAYFERTGKQPPQRPPKRRMA